jgi:fibronectin type 3 domain-containing protein
MLKEKVGIQSLTTTEGNNQVSLNWNAPSSNGGSAIVQYRVYRSTTSGGPYINIANTTSTSYVDATVSNGIPYYYVVTAENIKGESGLSNQASATPATVPSIPQSLTATEGNNQVSLTWTAPSSNGGSAITQYRVYRSTINGGPYTNIDNTTNLFYVDITASNGILYYYVVTADNDKGEGGFSNQVAATPATIPGAPQSVSSTKGNNQVVLNWVAPISNGGSAITQYHIYRSTTSGGPYTEIGFSVTLTYTDNTVVNGNIYYYVITSENSKGEGGFSNQVSAIPSTIPSVPQSLQLTIGNNQIVLNWTTPLSDGGLTITGYRIFRSLSSGGSYIEIGTSGTLSYIDNTANNGNTYYYIVKAFNTEGDSLASSEVLGTPSTFPSSPQNLQGDGQNNTIIISWNAPVSDGGSTITQYQVYRANITGGPYILIANVTTLNYTDYTVFNGITYYYVVTATNINGEGSQSLEIGVKPSTVASSPLNLNATSENLKITINWAEPLNDGGSFIFEYRVYRSEFIDGPFKNTANVTGLSYIDFNVENGVTYFYKISAVNQNGESGSSNIIDGTPSTIPFPPANLSGIGENTFALLSWELPENDGGAEIIEYNIYRSNESEGIPILIGSTSELTYNDTDLINGISVYYKVSAVNVRGESAFSNEIAIVPKVPIISTTSSTITTSSKTPTSLSTTQSEASAPDNQSLIIGSIAALVATFGAGIIYARRRRG